MQVQSINPPAAVQIDCDGYVPLVVRVNSNAKWPPKYWRTGDFKHSLVEIAVDPSTGTVCKIVVTSIRDVSADGQSTDAVSRRKRSDGVPNALLTVWEGEQTRVDVEGQVRGYLEGRTFTVVLGDDQKDCNVVNCDRVNFLMNSSNELCGFQVEELTDQELENLRYAIGL